MTTDQELESQLRHASFFLQASLEAQGKLTAKLDAFVTALVDLLIERGTVDQEELLTSVGENRQLQAEERAGATGPDGKLPAWPTVLVRDEKEDDPFEPVVPVNCAERLHICKAVCCSLRFPLSPSEIEGGKLKWDLGHPYMIRQSDHGFCVHNDRGTGGCTVYEDRPQVCHAYSCAKDERIWADFDGMVLNEEFLNNRPGSQFRFTPERIEAPVEIRPRVQSVPTVVPA